MGKGDKRTRRGKIFNRSYGKSRLQTTSAGANKGATTGKKKSK
jgi:ribosomal small subunit protein bTHX